MFIKIILIFALLEFSLTKEYDAKYLPMEKNSKYGDDVCSYTDDEQFYVKSCEKGKFCHVQSTIQTLDYSRGKVDENSNIEICQDVPKVYSLYSYNEEGCSNDFECEEDYKCIGKVCSKECDTGKFYFGEEIIEPDAPVPVSVSKGCKDNSEKGTDGICYEITKNRDGSETKQYTSPKPNKICGKITFIDEPRDDLKGIYYINKYQYVYKGEVEDGDYVLDEKLCKSGFALYFFKDGKTEDPKDSSLSGINNKMYLRCVTPLSVSKNENNECSINYKINDGDILRYNVEHIRSLPAEYDKINDFCTISISTSTGTISTENIYIKFKYEKYREFYSKISEEERKTCGDLDYTNKFSCENNELIKLWYFYNNPEKYNIYNERKKLAKVIDYYIQRNYPCYSLSKFLNIKLFYLLILLLF